MSPEHKAKAYLLEGCPFSFKFWLFMIESGLANRLEVIRCNPQDPQFEAIKAKLSTGLGKRATFPTVEVEPGRYQSDSDELIRFYSDRNGIAANSLPALTFYIQTIFPKLLELEKIKGGH